MTALLLAALTLHAPAPLPRPPDLRPRPFTPGGWVMEIDGQAFAARFNADGTYSLDDSFLGVWSWHPQTRTLYVVEWLRWTPERETLWSIRLDARLESIDAGRPRVRLWKR